MNKDSIYHELIKSACIMLVLAIAIGIASVAATNFGEWIGKLIFGN